MMNNPPTPHAPEVHKNADEMLISTSTNPYPCDDLRPWKLFSHRLKNGKFVIIDRRLDIAVTPECASANEAWPIANANEREYHDRVIEKWKIRARAEKQNHGARHV